MGRTSTGPDRRIDPPRQHRRLIHGAWVGLLSAVLLTPSLQADVALVEQCDRNAGFLLSQQPIRFATGTAEISGESFSALQMIVELATSCPTAKIAVDGHTDNRGSEQGNQALSAARAKSVADYLTAHGISAERIRSQGYGSAQPIADNATRDGRRINRRVVIRFLTRWER